MDEARLAPGTPVGDRYVVEQLIGAGGLAEVYRVRHNELGNLAAFKLLTWHRKSLAERLLREGRIQAQLKHPNIVAVSDVVRVSGQVGLLMELVDGSSLDRVLEEGPLPADKALELFAQVLAAVSWAHDAGVLHRDLKPANVLLARVPGGWQAKVTDFGIAKVLEDEMGSSTMSGVTMGTPGYMAPEQVRDSASVDRRTDVFALGAILYEMLTGRRAFAGPDGEFEITATLERVPPPLDSLVEGLDERVPQAVSRAFSRDLEDRFTSCRELAEALGLGEHPALAAVPGTTTVSLALNPKAWSTPPSSATFHGGPRPTIVATDPEPQTPPPAVHTSRAGTAGVFVVGGIIGFVLVFLAVLALLVGYAMRYEPERRALRDQQEAPAPTPTAPVEPELEPPPEPEPEPVVEPEPAPAAEPAPAPAVEPEPAPDVEPEPVIEPEPTVEPEPAAPEPTPEPDVAVAVAPEPLPAPEPAVDPMGSIAGTYEGQAGGRPFELRLSGTADDVRAEAVFIVPGTAGRRVDLTGRLDPATLRLTLRSASDVSFQGVVAGNQISGTYEQRNRRPIDFVVTR